MTSTEQPSGGKAEIEVGSLAKTGLPAVDIRHVRILKTREPKAPQTMKTVTIIIFPPDYSTESLKVYLLASLGHYDGDNLILSGNNKP